MVHSIIMNYGKHSTVHHCHGALYLPVCVTSKDTCSLSVTGSVMLHRIIMDYGKHSPVHHRHHHYQLPSLDHSTSMVKKKSIPTRRVYWTIHTFIQHHYASFLYRWCHSESFRMCLEMETVTKFSDEDVRPVSFGEKSEVVETESSHCWRAFSVSSQQFLSSVPEEQCSPN